VYRIIRAKQGDTTNNLRMTAATLKTSNMKNLFRITFLLFNLLAFSQNLEKRKAYTLEIAADETQQYQTEIEEIPYFVKEKILQLFCGESVFVECEVQGDSISTMKVVAQNIHPEKTIVIAFTQDSEDRKSISTMLQVKNPFDRMLTYEAMMFTPLGQTWQPTSILPISNNLENFEMWPHAIVTLVLQNWEFK